MPQPVTAKVIQEEQESAKKKGSYYVTLEIEGFTRYYTSENEACGRAFAGLAGKTVSISADGRAETATISIGNAVPAPSRSGSPATQRGRDQATPPPRPNPQPAPAEREQPQADQDPVMAARDFIAHNRTLSIIALQAAYSVKLEFEAVHKFELQPETFTAIYTSMLYGAGARGIERHLPISGVHFKPLTTGGAA